ncbi:hypothetical protein FOZ62_010593, partial [Perkinsus olseni]
MRILDSDIEKHQRRENDTTTLNRILKAGKWPTWLRIGSEVEVLIQGEWKTGMVMELGYEYIYCAYEYDNLKWYQDFSIHAVRRAGQQQRTLKDELIKRFSSTLTQQRNNRRKRTAPAAAAAATGGGGGGGDGSSRSSKKRRGKSERLPERDNNNKTGRTMRRRGSTHSIRSEEEKEVLSSSPSSSARVCDICRDADEVDDNPIIYCKM